TLSVSLFPSYLELEVAPGHHNGTLLLSPSLAISTRQIKYNILLVRIFGNLGPGDNPKCINPHVLLHQLYYNIMPETHNQKVHSGSQFFPIQGYLNFHSNDDEELEVQVEYRSKGKQLMNDRNLAITCTPLRRADVKEISSFYAESDSDDEEDESEEVDLHHRSKEKLIDNDGKVGKDRRKSIKDMSLTSGSEPILKRSRLDSVFMNTFMDQTPECYRQVKVKTASNKQSRKEVLSAICRFFYHAGVPLQASDSVYFYKMLELVGQHGQGLSLLDHRTELKRMFQSSKWVSSGYSKASDGKEVEKIVLNTGFWKKVHFVVKSVDPIMQVLQTVESGDSFSMPSIYYEMYRAKLAIKSFHGDDGSKYGPFLAVVENHWNSLFYHRLYMAAYFLNPAYRYQPDFVAHAEVVRGLNDCITRLEPDNAKRVTASMQLSDYTSAKADFGTELAISTRTDLDPGNPLYGNGTD
ncbi:hypothetical protein F8388_011247, partial [Cannabis sativa]